MSEQSTDGSGNKIVFLYFLVALIALAVASVLFITFSSSFTYNKIRCLQLAAYFVHGMLSLSYAKRRFLTAKSNYPRFIIKLFFIVLAALVVFYLFFNKQLIPVALSCSAIFILPFVVSYTYNVYASMPAADYKVWSHPKDIVLDKAIIFVNSVTLKFKLTVSPDEGRPQTFETVVPAQMALGEIFKAFLIHQRNNNNVVINQTRDDGREVGWIFFKTAVGGLYSKALDPALNLWDNNVKPGSLISVKRVAFSKNEKRVQDKIITNGNY